MKHGANVKVLQDILGHEDLRTTIMIYGAMATSEVLEAHDQIDYLPAENDSEAEPPVIDFWI